MSKMLICNKNDDMGDKPVLWLIGRFRRLGFSDSPFSRLSARTGLSLLRRLTPGSGRRPFFGVVPLRCAAGGHLLRGQGRRGGLAGG